MVKPGDAVVCGQKLGIIESMKMEIPLKSHVTGTIHSLLKSEGGTGQKRRIPTAP